MTRDLPRTDRRRLLLAAGAGLALAGAGQGTPLAAQTPDVAGYGTPVSLPVWQFVLHTVQDPYAGTMQAPAAPPAGSRHVAAEVEVINDSDQALAFTPVEIRLRDAAGIEYRGGGAIGSEPMISVRNLNPGERSRGWIWFTVPLETSLVEMAYVAPDPQFRVTLQG